MAGYHKTEDMGIDAFTWPNLATCGVYFLFMFLIKSLALNTFTGIATNEIRSLIEKCHIQIMKEKIDYIYDVLVFKYFDRFEGFWRCKRGFFRIVGEIYRIELLVEMVFDFCAECRNSLFACVYTKESDEGLKAVEGDLNQMDFVDDKYVESFEALEYSAKSLEDKFEERTKNLEDKLIRLEDKFDNRNEVLEFKLNTILNKLEDLTA